MKDFKKYYLIPAERSILYKALTFKPTIELWTGAPAVFEKKPGTDFSMWDESIQGKNLEFVEDEMIRQQWYFGQDSEESIVTIKLHDDKKGTSMEVRHTNIPDEAYDDITAGWSQVYIRELISFFS
jgi:activator of HSP90 ATPase